MKAILRKILLIILTSMTLTAGLSAQEGEKAKVEGESAPAQADPRSAYVPPATSFNPLLTILGVYMPNNDMIDLAIPYFMPMLGGRFSHRFTEFRKVPELNFVADGELAPLWLRAGAHFAFKPLSFITFAAGGDISTSWGFDLGFLSMDFMGSYDGDKNEYDYFTPFTHWVYDGWASVALQYDIGALFTGGKQHIILGGNYKATYKAMTGIDNGEVWLHQGTGEQANGFSYNANAALTYLLSHNYLKSVGFSASASSYYSDSYFDEKYRVCDPTFVDLTFSLNASGAIGPRNRWMLMVPVSGKRDMAEEKDLRPITEPDGRKWQMDGIILTFTHVF